MAVSQILEARRSRAEDQPKQLRVITVRMTREMHERLKALAHDQRTSLNELATASLEAALRELEVVAADSPAE
jgi:predicted HicB family RNase H-like nuclease